MACNVGTNVIVNIISKNYHQHFTDECTPGLKYNAHLMGWNELKNCNKK